MPTVVGSARVPDDVSLDHVLRTLREAATAAAVPGPHAWNRWVAGASYAVALGTGLRPQELARLRACDVSLTFRVLAVAAPKAGAPRLLPLGPILLAWLDPLVDALRRTGQDEIPCFSLWQGDALRAPTPARLRAVAQEVVGDIAAVPMLGQLRHAHWTRREAAAVASAGRDGDAELDRWRSALFGHGQSGGWSVVLPQRFRRAQADLLAEQPRWLGQAPQLRAGPFAPPPLLRSRSSRVRRQVPQARSARDWVLASLQPETLPLDRLPAVRQAVWDAAVATMIGAARAPTLAALAAIELVGFGDLLAPDWVARLQRVTWAGWTPDDQGVWLAFCDSDGPPPLRIWAGPTVRMLGDTLRHLGAPTPFAALDPAVVRHLLRQRAGVTGRDPVRSLQQANLVLHLLTHATDAIGYLSGRVERLLASDQRPSPRRRRSVPDHGLAGLRRRLAGHDGRLTRNEFDRLVHETCPTVDLTAPVAQQLLPSRIVGTLRLEYRGPLRPQRRRSVSPHTLLARLGDLCCIGANQGSPASPSDAASSPWGPTRSGACRRRAALTLWSAYHRAAGLSVARPAVVDPRPQARFARLTSWDEVDAAIAAADPGARPPLSLYVALATRIRAAEASRVQAQDLRLYDVDARTIAVWVTRAKGGHSRWMDVTVPGPLRPAVAKALRAVRTLPPDRPVFCPLVPEPFTARRLTAAVQRRLATASPGWHPHQMRTLWATTADRAGMDRALIANGLAHVQVRTVTTHYVALDEGALRAAAASLTWLTAGSVVSVAHVRAVRGVRQRQAERDHRWLTARLGPPDRARSRAA